MRGEIKYIFPSYYVIETPSNILKENTPYNHFIDLVLIDCKNHYLYTINNEIGKVLLRFRKPHSLRQITKKNNSPAISSFIKQLIKRNILIQENSIQESFLSNLRMRRFDKCDVIKTIKNKANISILLVEDSYKQKFVIKKFTGQKNKRQVSRFLQEFIIYQILGEHPLICKLVEYNEKKLFGKLEYIEGKNLNNIIIKGELTILQKIKIAEQIMEVCALIHSKNVIHGDIHAGQFIINKDFNLKIFDFGFGFYSLEELPEITPIRGGMIFYYEPENIKSDCYFKFAKYKPSTESEIYRIGCLLYYLFYEKFPLTGFTWKEYYYNVQNSLPTFIHDIQSDNEILNIFDKIINKCLKKNKNNRFKSAVFLWEYYKLKTKKITSGLV